MPHVVVMLMTSNSAMSMIALYMALIEYKMLAYKYFHCGNKMAMRPSSLHTDISYTLYGIFLLNRINITNFISLFSSGKVL